MAKKKIKAASNRGYATSSAPSKKVEEKHPKEEEIIKPTKQPKDRQVDLKKEEGKKDILQLVQKYQSLHESKADAILDRLTNDTGSGSNARKVRPFRLRSELERELVSIIKQRQSNLLESQLISNENERDKTVEQLDILYRVLIKLGFSDEDVLSSFKTTLSKSIDDHLDWLCINVPYDRLPVGFFDKYFNEDDQDEQVTLIHNANKKDTSNFRSDQKEKEEEELILLKNKEDESLDDIKSHILKAAERYESVQEKEDVNERHAKLRVYLQELENLLPSNKKNKKKQKEESLSEEQTKATEKEITRIKADIHNLEADWEYDKRTAQELFIKQLEIATEEKRKKLQEDIEKRKIEQEKQRWALEEKSETSEMEGDDEDGMFGGLMMAEEEMDSACNSTPSNTVTSWTVIDLTTEKSWKGMYPKEFLAEYCKKHGLGNQKFQSKEVSSGMWRSTLQIANGKQFNSFLKYESPEGVVTTARLSSENFTATFALFDLDSSLSVYKAMPKPYRELWIEWLEEKKLKEEYPRLEMDKQRLTLLTELVNKSTENAGKSDNLKDSPETFETKPNESSTNSFNKQISKRKKAFNSSQERFKKRLNSKDYMSMKEKRGDLPIAAYRKDILELVKKNQVLIISGETGCGKSTQVPQFLAEDLLMGSSNGLVICTQPRRISAMSIASRVSIEMGDSPKAVGSRDALVGYQIRLESKISDENVLLYCTTGILLQRLQSDLSLQGVSHVIIDEVHERTIESDFLLIMLKKLCQLRPDLKIILMSATVEARRFQEYFDNAPTIAVPGRTYPVQVQFLEDVVEATEKGNVNISGRGGSQKRLQYEIFKEESDDDDIYNTRNDSKLTISNNEETVNINESDNEGESEYSRQTRKMIKRMDDKKINYDLILQLLEHICIQKPVDENSTDKKETAIPSTGAILVFLPGMNEIRALYDLVSSHNVFGKTEKFLLIPLHSTLSSDHQEKAFEVPPEGVRKIVFSTNIAETGVTISDVTVVIDTGMARTINYDDKRRVSRLLQKYVAKANAKQRRGRAGRVQEGICFHLFTKQRFEQMPDYEMPEILRLPLEELCLRIKVYNLGSIVDVLGSALDAPSVKVIKNAISRLREIHALNADESLTPLGAHLVNLPVDIHIGKMILFGAIFRCLDPILTIAAALSFKSPFVRPFGKEYEADRARARFECNNSDFLTVYQAYEVWRDELMSVRGKPGWIRKMHEFCKENYLSHQNLETIEEMKRQFLGLLISIGFVKTDDLDTSINRYDVKRSIRLCHVPPAYDKYRDFPSVINAALTAGLYPKVAEYVRETDTMANRLMELKFHPSSALFRQEKKLHSEFFVYNALVANGNDYQKDKAVVWEAASIEPAILMLLSTNIEINHKQRRMVIDGWLSFDCFARTAAILKFFRHEVNNWFAENMKEPKIDLTAYNQEILDALCWY
ncbi:hypothetical protein G6F60_004143 [Rhizopus arrhizus]|nr:hypothetical protein G6F60_004143 [Rhizopus arrhizus]